MSSVGAKCVFSATGWNERVREVITVLLSSSLKRTMVNFVCESFKIPMIKFKFERVRLLVFGPSESDFEMNEMIFWRVD